MLFPAVFREQIRQNGDQRDAQGGQPLGHCAEETDQIEHQIREKSGFFHPRKKPGYSQDHRGQVFHIGGGGAPPEQKAVTGEQYPAGGHADFIRPQFPAEINRSVKTEQRGDRAGQSDSEFVQMPQRCGGEGDQPVREQRFIKIDFAVNRGMQKIF